MTRLRFAKLSHTTLGVALVMALGVSGITSVAEAQTSKIYRIDPATVVPGFTAGSLADGVRVGQLLPIPVATPLPVGSFVDQIDSFKKNANSMGQLITEETAARKKEVAPPPALVLPGGESGALSMPTSTGVTSSAAGGPLILPELRWAELARCMSNVVDPLKNALRAGRAGNLLLQSQIESMRIDRDRGDGKSVTPVGIICGRYLGAAGGPRVTPFEEIKLATAAAAASQSNALNVQHLMRAYVAAHHPDSPVRRRPLWVLLWKRLSVHAAFAPAQGLDLDLATHYAQIRAAQSFTIEQVGLKMTTDQTEKNQELDALFELGINFAKAVLP